MSNEITGESKTPDSANKNARKQAQKGPQKRKDLTLTSILDLSFVLSITNQNLVDQNVRKGVRCGVRRASDAHRRVSTRTVGNRHYVRGRVGAFSLGQNLEAEGAQRGIQGVGEVHGDEKVKPAKLFDHLQSVGKVT